MEFFCRLLESHSYFSRLTTHVARGGTTSSFAISSSTLLSDLSRHFFSTLQYFLIEGFKQTCLSIQN